MCGACIVYGDDDGVFVIFPEPSLTPENLSTVLAIMKYRLWQCTTLTGTGKSGLLDGSFEHAQFSEPGGLCLDPTGKTLWQVFGACVNIPISELSRIWREMKQAVIPYLISHHPCLSWTLIASALYRIGALGVGGDSSHRALDRLQQLFPTGTVYMYTVHSSLSATYRRISVKCWQ